MSSKEAQAARLRERNIRTRLWEQGKIGNIERRIAHIMACAPDKAYTTGELAREIYCHPLWDQNFRYRPKGEKPPKLKSWHRLAIRKAAPAFCVCAGRALTRAGRPMAVEITPGRALLLL
jgi:hypothetical protein